MTRSRDNQSISLDNAIRQSEGSEARTQQQSLLEQQRKENLLAYRVQRIKQAINDAEAEIELIKKEIQRSSRTGNSGNSVENINRRDRITALRKQISLWNKEVNTLK